MDAHEIHGANHVKIGCELAEVSEIVSMCVSSVTHQHNYGN